MNVSSKDVSKFLLQPEKIKEIFLNHMIYVITAFSGHQVINLAKVMINIE